MSELRDPAGALGASNDWPFLEAAPTAVMITDATLDVPGPRIVYVNRAFEVMTGWPRDRVLGATPRILQGPETEGNLFRDMKAALRAGTTWRGEATNYRRDGTPFRMRWSVSPVRDGQGRITHYMAMQADVTAEHAREDEGNRLEALVTRFVDASPEAVIIVDGDLRVVRINAGAARTFGWRAEELKGQSIDVLMPQRYRSRHRRYVARFAEGAQHSDWMRQTGEIRGLRRDGSEFSARGSVVKIDESGEAGFAVFMRDLTDWQIQQSKLQTRERRLRQAQHVAHLGHWCWDIAMREFVWSAELYDLLGYAPQAIDPGYNVLLAHVEPEERMCAQDFFGLAFDGEDPGVVDLTFVRRDGVRRILHAQAEVERDDDGALQAVFGVLQDVTRQRAAERALANANLELDAANSAKTRFLAMLGHELRTPLNAINGFADLIRQEIHGPVGRPAYTEYARHIRDSGQHLLQLVESLLDVTRVESQHIVVDEMHVRSDELAAKVVARARAETADGDVTIQLGTVPVRCLLVDPDLLEAALLNLVRNAVKFSPEGGTIRVEGVDKASGAYAVEVIDQGPGIPDHAMDRVMRPFEQADGAFGRKHDGMGIGLYLSESYLNLHGGRVDLASPADGGTVATAWLPARRILALPECGADAA